MEKVVPDNSINELASLLPGLDFSYFMKKD